MAASVLKSLALWIEKELMNVSQPERLSAVIDALESVLRDTHKRQDPQEQGAGGSTHPQAIPEDGYADDDPASILDTHVSQASQGMQTRTVGS